MFFKRKPKKETKKEIIIERELKAIDIKDIIAPAALEIKQNYIKVGEKFVCTYFVLTYPSSVTTNWLSPIINFDRVFDISMFIYPIDSGQVLKQLQKKITEVEALINERQQKGLVRDPELEAAYRNIEELRDKLIQVQEKMFKFGLYFTIYADKEEDIKKIEKEIRQILESQLIYIKPALFRQKEGLNSACPLMLDELKVSTSMNTGPLSASFPFVSFELTSDKGILYGINRHNNSLIIFDRFSLENGNVVIFAKSGSGKSIRGEEPVLVKKNNKIQLTKIGPLIENLIKKQGIDFYDEELEGKTFPGISVWTFDKNLKGKWGEVKIAARKKAPKEFYKFKTQSGREITTTGDHNMLILKEGKVMAVKSSEVKKGEYIPLPRFLPQAENKTENLDLFHLLRNSENIYVKGAKEIINDNYQTLKTKEVNPKYDKYLYRYRRGVLIPIKYLWQIQRKLKLNLKEKLSSLSLTSHTGRGELPVIFPLSKEFLKILGYIISEGTIGKNFIKISNKDKEIIQDIRYCLSKINVLHFKTKSGVDIRSAVFVEIVKKLGVRQRSSKKIIPKIAFNLPSKKIGYLLSAYFEGEGGIENSTSITALSKSKRLISEITYLLYNLKITGRISKVKKKAANCNWKRKRTYWKISISGQENLRKFAENINFVSRKKRKSLEKILKRKGNTNVDIIPGVDGILKEISQLLPSGNRSWNYNFSSIKNGAFNPSRETLRQIIKEIEERVQHFKDLEPRLKILSELPELDLIINSGKNDRNLNRILWKELDRSWSLMKNQQIQPQSMNVFKGVKALGGPIYSLKEVKECLHSGFKEMDLPIKYYDRSLQSALIDRPQSNTRYTMIQKAARFIWENYQRLLNENIFKVEEKLNQLKLLANSDLFWDPIVEIKRIRNKKEEYVYDLTVDNEVFLAGEGGMFVHNSYFQKLEILRYLTQGADVIVIDPENEYKYLAQTVGGANFNISLTSAHHINPFDLPPVPEGESREGIFRSNIVNLVGLLRLMLGGLTPEEDAIMDQAITLTYQSRDITPQSDFENQTPPLLSDLQEILKGMEGAESLSTRLEKYTKGAYAGFLNQHTNVDLKNNRMVVFSIRDLEDELRPIAMYLILHYVWNIVRSELKKRILVIDEAWWMMKYEDSASFLYGMVKRARKYYLGVSTITQDVNDFMASTYGQPIISNSSLQILLKQSPATIDIVANTFNLTKEERYLLLQAEVGEGLFFAGTKHVAIKVVASFTEDQIITTDPEQILAIKRAKQELEKRGE